MLLSLAIESAVAFLDYQMFRGQMNVFSPAKSAGCSFTWLGTHNRPPSRSDCAGSHCELLSSAAVIMCNCGFPSFGRKTVDQLRCLFFYLY
jgi:hypothetical protein